MYGYKQHSIGGGSFVFAIFRTEKAIIDTNTGKINPGKWDAEVEEKADYIARVVLEDDAQRLVKLLNR
jgi:hypothetical protein